MNPRKSGRPNLTVILPVFNNADSLQPLCEGLRAALISTGISFELLFVNDASADASAEILGELARDYGELSLLQMTRNVGQQAAVLYGLAHAGGECCVIMDADLQDPPAALPLLWAARASGISAVFAGRRGRYQSLTRHLTSRIYKSVQGIVTGLPPDVGIFVLLERPLVQALLDFRTSYPMIPIMIGCLAVPATSIPVERQRREHGRSSYRGLARLRAGVKGILCVLQYRYWPAKAPYLQLHQEDTVAAFRPARVIEGGRQANRSGRSSGKSVEPSRQQGQP